MNILFFIISVAFASLGDESPYFKKCLNHCKTVKCRGSQFLRYLDTQPTYMMILGWDCLTEFEIFFKNPKTIFLILKIL